MEITQEWVEQFIKKCADFLGKDYDTEIYSVCTNHLYDCGYRNPEYIENPINWDCYHSDWNWIMEVVDKIQYYRACILSKNHCEVHMMPTDSVTSINIGAISSRLATIQAIDQFIDWYYKQKEL
jgi:hypothetical protein